MILFSIYEQERLYNQKHALFIILSAKIITFNIEQLVSFSVFEHFQDGWFRVEFMLLVHFVPIWKQPWIAMYQLVVPNPEIITMSPPSNPCV